MKKTAAILLVGLLMFNWFGYRLLNDLIQDTATMLLECQLDRQQYDESQLISFKVPVTHLSYYSNSPAFERVDGHMDIDGVPYQYVKQRIYNDSLELLCIPNHTAQKLRGLASDYFKLVNNIERPHGRQQDPHPSFQKIFLADPYNVTERVQLYQRSFTVVPRSACHDVELPSTPAVADERPPDLTA